MATDIPSANIPVAITNNCIDTKMLAIHTKEVKPEVKPAVTEVAKPSEKETEEGLFSSSYISPEVVSLLPENYTLRPLRRSDYKNGFLDVLSVLTKVGEFTTELWNERYDWMAKRNDEYYVLVICDGTGRVVGTGSLIVERKFIHSAGMVGHIEDIAIESGQQGKKLGLRMIHALDYVAKEAGCYKSILDCSEANEGFYLKCGFKRAGLEMAHYY
ncbi:Glucosamine-phosphate N-acetyltransferase-like protein [Microsporum audouinii]